MATALLISVKPEFAEKIFSGDKTIELRKCTPKSLKGDLIIIYSTNPVKAVIGICQVSEIIKLSPKKMWQYHKVSLGIDKKRFDAYYENSETAVGIKLQSICLLSSQISLTKIKSILPDFQPPQTFRYFNKPQLLKSYLKLT